MSEGQTVVVLEVVIPGVTPDYCVHGKATCMGCDEWVWLGDKTFEVVRSGAAAPLCEPCALRLIPPDAELVDRIHNHRRADGPHT
jgi:hypothetical protein